MSKPPQNLNDIIETKARSEPGYAIAYALLKLAHAQENLAVHVKYLGTGNAASPMGAIEFLAVHIGEKMDAIADAMKYHET